MTSIRRGLTVLVAFLSFVACGPIEEVADVLAPADASLFEREDAGIFFSAEEGPQIRAPEVPLNLSVHDFGVVPVSGGRSSTIALDVPEGTESVTLLFFGAPGSVLIVERLLSSEGVIIADALNEDVELTPDERQLSRGFPAQFYSPGRAIASVQSGAFVLPNTPDIELLAGRYHFNIGSYSRTFDGEFEVEPLDSPVAVFAVFKERDDEPKALDLTVYTLGAEELDAERLRESELFSEALAEMDNIFGQVEIAIGEVNFVDIEESDELLELNLDDDLCGEGEMLLLFERADPMRSDTMQIFLIERFSCKVSGGIEIGQGISGITGGLPGVPFSNANNSGVVLALSNLLDSTRLSVVMSHEIGHFLGLFHSIESPRNSAVADIISDTSEVPIVARDNLMFFAAESSELTAGQGEVLRGHPLVHSLQ